MVGYFSHLERLFFPCILSALHFSHVYWNVLWQSKWTLNLEPDSGLIAMDLDPQTYAWANFRPVSWVLIFPEFPVIADDKQFICGNYSEHFQIFKASLNVKSFFSMQLRCSPFFLFLFTEISKHAVQLSSVAHSCLTLCDPMDCSMPGFPVHHQLLEFAQTHVHRVDDAIQPSHPLPSPSPPVLNLPQHQGLFQWVSSLHQVAKVSVQLCSISLLWVCFFSFSLAVFLPLPSLLSPKLTIYIDKLTQESAIFSPPAKSDNYLDVTSCYFPPSSMGDWEPPSCLFPESESHSVVSDSCSPLDYTVHGIPQARILEWVDFPFSRGSFQTRDQTQVSRVAHGFFIGWTTGQAQEYWRG